MDMPEEILKRDYSEEFDTLRKNRMVTSHYKYGWVSENYPTGLASAVGSLKKRLELYEKTGNREWLLDVANFAMIEFMFPVHPDAHYRATPSAESPGLDGTSSRELLER